LVNFKFGEVGISEAEGTMVCFFSLKKSRKDCLISRDVMAAGKVLVFMGVARRMGTIAKALGN
jgi:hypothetical protein